MADTRPVELAVIGSGPGGYKAAVSAAHLGAKVTLIEKSLPGGTCLNQGCVPKKTLLYLAALIEDVNALQGQGLEGHVEGNFGAAISHKDKVVEGIRDQFPLWLRRLGVRVLKGEAVFLDERRIKVEGEEACILSPERIIIATGAVPRQHPACPTDGVHILNSRDFMFHLRHLPRSILCLGGGAIGTELGFLLHQFGSEVTIVERAGRLLDKPNIPARASTLLERKLKRLGVEVKKGVTVTCAEVKGDEVEVTLSDGTVKRYEKVLVAVGRRPLSEHLKVERAGIAVDGEGYILTNEHLQTSVPHIYAVGDVKPGPMTANAALHDAKVAALNAVQGNTLRRNYYRVPMVIDSALEIATVGLTEEQAEEAGFEPDVARANFSGSPKARGRLDVEGFIEVVHDEETGQLLGGCIVGPEAGEQIHMLSAACQSKRGLWFFTDINYSHPSWCEELENAIDPYTSAFSKSGKELFQPGIYYETRP